MTFLSFTLAALGGCALVGIDPDEIDVADDEAGSLDGVDTVGETANDAGGTDAADEAGETAADATTGDTSGDTSGDADTNASSDSTGDPTTSDTGTEGTTGGGVCDPAEQDPACLACIKESCCDLYDACLLDANCSCNLECALTGQVPCECDDATQPFLDLSECFAAQCVECVP